MDIPKDLSTRIVNDYEKLRKLTEVNKELGHTTVVTIGTFDMIHPGHSRYLKEAKSLGDYLIVGVDSDRAVKVYKGPQRPMVPEQERLEMLLHTKYVDYVTLVDDVDEDGHWHYGLIEAIRPDIFVAVQDSYPDHQQGDIKLFCGEVIILPRQAETSTSEKIRTAMVAQNKPLSARLRLIADQLDAGQLEP